MLFISGPGTRDIIQARCTRFNLAIEMLFISGIIEFRNLKMHIFGFNLAIEMLFISGGVRMQRHCLRRRFQSRNRDAFHFRRTRTQRGVDDTGVSIS